MYKILFLRVKNRFSVFSQVFNQITLICDWFFNVDCSKARQFENYSNSRLYTDAVLLDNQLELTAASLRAPPTVVSSVKKTAPAAKKAAVETTTAAAAEAESTESSEPAETTAASE